MMKFSLCTLSATLLLFFIALHSSSAMPGYSDDGKVFRFKSAKEMEEEAKRSFIAKKNALDKQFRDEMEVTEASFIEKKKKLESEMMKKRQEVEKRHQWMASEIEKQSRSQHDLDEASLSLYKKLGNSLGVKDE